MKIEFTNEQAEEMITLYQTTMPSTRQLGIKFHVSKSVISRVLKENGVKLRSDNHIYKADYNKFASIDSAEKAYWLGFLAADGCNYVREQNASVILNLSRKDRQHLEKFKAFMDSNVNIVDHVQTEGVSNNTLMSKITFNSKKMSSDLSALGVVPNKSLVLKPPKINEEYYLSFILGYFDGDGSIFKTSQYNNYGINIEGTKEILEWINSILNISDKLEKRNDDNKNNYYIRCGGVDKPYQIMKQLYESCPVHLDRKFEIYKSLETVVLNRNIK